MSVTELPQEIRKSREVNGCLLEFEFFPVGTPTKKGEPRKQDWRAYFWTDTKRRRMTSVSTLLGAISPKPGLVPWAEAAGVKGYHRAVALGEIDPTQDSAFSALRKVRSLKLGADAARDEAAERGIDIHAVLEEYMRTGSVPNPAHLAPDRRGYYQAVTRWLLATDPQPLEIEQLVCSPEDGYAGRMDLLAQVDGQVGAFDFKTSEKGQIFDSSHAQLRLYEKAHVRCGGNPFDFAKIVAFAANGEFREMDCAPIDVGKALLWYSELRPVTSACESANRAEREARKAA